MKQLPGADDKLLAVGLRSHPRKLGDDIWENKERFVHTVRKIINSNCVDQGSREGREPNERGRTAKQTTEQKLPESKVDASKILQCRRLLSLSKAQRSKPVPACPGGTHHRHGSAFLVQCVKHLYFSIYYFFVGFSVNHLFRCCWGGGDETARMQCLPSMLPEASDRFRRSSSTPYFGPSPPLQAHHLYVKLERARIIKQREVMRCLGRATHSRRRLASCKHCGRFKVAHQNNAFNKSVAADFFYIDTHFSSERLLIYSNTYTSEAHTHLKEIQTIKWASRIMEFAGLRGLY